jgi:hypothetical protein
MQYRRLFSFELASAIGSLLCAALILGGTTLMMMRSFGPLVMAANTYAETKDDAR